MQNRWKDNRIFQFELICNAYLKVFWVIQNFTNSFRLPFNSNSVTKTSVRSQATQKCCFINSTHTHCAASSLCMTQGPGTHGEFSASELLFTYRLTPQEPAVELHSALHQRSSPMATLSSNPVVLFIQGGLLHSRKSLWKPEYVKHIIQSAVSTAVEKLINQN